MEKTLTIANAHSQNQPTEFLTLDLTGGSPWFTYVWLNDFCFTVVVNGETGKVTIEETM